MIGVALKGLFGRKLRAVLTGFAVVLGVAMVSGSFVLTDTINKSFTAIYEQSYKGADAVVSSKEAIAENDEDSSSAPGFPASLLTRIDRLRGVDAASGSIEDEAKLIDDEGKLISRSSAPHIAIGIDPTSERLNPLSLVTGAWPRGGRQAAVDRSTADKEDLAVGDVVRVVAGG